MATAIPQSVDELTPDWLTVALADRLEGATVVGVRAEPLGAGQGFVGELLRLELEIDGEPARVPKRMIAKLPTTVAANRVTAEVLGAYEREIFFYRELASRVGYRTAQLYHADMDPNPAGATGPAVIAFLDRLPAWLLRPLMAFFRWLGSYSRRKYLLLIEDLAPSKVGNQLEGLPLSACEPILRAVARTQASFWGDRELEKPYWVAHPEIGSKMGTLVFRDSRPEFEERFAAFLSDEHRAILDWLDANGAALNRALHTEAPPTLIHGDLRLDNMMFDDEEVPYLLDWQGVSRGAGVWDVAYFLSGTLALEVSTEDEESLVRVYHDALREAGVSDYSFETCLRDYRRSMLTILSRMVTVDQMDIGGERGVQLIDGWIERVLRRATAIDLATLLAQPMLRS